jgi:hypothetical protein
MCEPQSDFPLSLLTAVLGIEFAPYPTRWKYLSGYNFICFNLLIFCIEENELNTVICALFTEFYTGYIIIFIYKHTYLTHNGQNEGKSAKLFIFGAVFAQVL